MAKSEDKLELLRSLLKENPNLGMKEANVTIREQFGTGVAPPQYSKIKKELEGSQLEEKKVEAKAPKEIPEQKNDIQEESNELESFFDGSAAKKVQTEALPENKIETNNSGEKLLPSQDEPPEEVVEEEEEDTTPVPTFPVSLEVEIPEAETVHLAGSFNKWKIEQYPLEKSDSKTWVFSDELPEGEHFYKFVINKKLWHLDVNKEYFVDPTGISHKITVLAN